jgi:olefin beta-lactone synthetase
LQWYNFYMTINLAKRLEENALFHPDKPAFIYKGDDHVWDSLSYGHFLELEKRFEKGLIALQIPPNTKAVLMTPPEIPFFALTFAMLKTGITPVMIDPAIGLKNVTSCLAETRPDIFIGTPLTHSLRVLFRWGQSSIKNNLTLNGILRAGRSTPDQDSTSIEALADAAIIFTSGSTGLPRGVIYTHDNLMAQMDMLVGALGLQGDEIDLPAFPVFAMIDLLLGVTAVIPDLHFPRPARVNPQSIVEALQTHKVDTLFASPVVLDRITQYAENHPIHLVSLKRVITAGAPAPVPVLENFIKCLNSEAKIYGIYGSTEALPIALVDCQEILNETRFATEIGAGICVGTTVDGANVQIIPISDDALSNEAETNGFPQGATGEIIVQGRAVTAAYSGSPEHNRLAKIYDSQGLIKHRMGDLGYFDEHKRLWYCGRKSHRVELQSGILFSERVEGIFNAHPAVYRTALVGIQIEQQTRPVLWVELKRTVRADQKKKIREELLKIGACYEMTLEIKDILFHKAFPTDVRHNSKIIRERLAEIAQRRMK